MSDRHDDIAEMLSETKRLLGDLEAPGGEEFSLDHILAEFGQGAAEPAQKEASSAAVKEETEEIPEPEMPKPVSPDTVELPKLKKEKVLQFPVSLPPRKSNPPLRRWKKSSRRKCCRSRRKKRTRKFLWKKCSRARCNRRWRIRTMNCWMSRFR